MIDQILSKIEESAHLLEQVKDEDFKMQFALLLTMGKELCLACEARGDVKPATIEKLERGTLLLYEKINKKLAAEKSDLKLLN